MSTPTKRVQVSSMQILFGSILAISLLLAINFSGRIAAGQRINSEIDGINGTISALHGRATALVSTLNYVGGDAYVGDWARTEGKMVKDGEILVIPVPGQMTPAPMATPFIPVVGSQPEPDDQNWILWWQLFFDSPPPEELMNSQ